MSDEPNSSPALRKRTPEERARAEKKRKLRTLLGRVVGLLVVAGIVGLGVVAYRPSPVPVDVAKVTRGELEVVVEEDGRTRVKDRFVVSAPIGGRIARMELHAGDAVTKGTIIARVQPLDSPLLDARSRDQAEARLQATLASRRQADATVARAKLALADAERELAAAKELAKGNAITQRELERADLVEKTRREELASAEFGAKVAVHEAAMARAALERVDRKGPKPGKDGQGDELVVTSPVDGRVLRVLRENEGAVQPGEPLVEIGDPSALEVVVDVLTADAVRIHPGARASILRWGGPKALDARVRLLEPSAFTRVSALGVEEQRVNVVLELSSPREEWMLLGDGYRVEARILVDRVTDVVSVPENAVFRQGELHQVYVFEEGMAKLRAIKLGLRNGVQAEVTEGLSEGTEVLVHPSDRVKDGVRVQMR
jgi:HlyD family secretion protein